MELERTPSLSHRFAQSWRSVGATTDARPVYGQLAARYAEPHRHYHTLEHVAATLSWLDWSYGLAERPDEIALALWFHDAVYDPAARDNEERSAALAKSELGAAGVAHDVIERVEALVLATRDHAAPRGDRALLVDIDLTILGASEEDFARFERNVRAEYRMFDDATYARGRAHVLRKLASRDPLYQTSFVAAELERRARANLNKAIAHWDAHGPS